MNPKIVCKRILLLLLLMVIVNTCQSTCEDREFTCEDGECIPRGDKCDKDPDCTDRSDEGVICSCPANATNLFICPLKQGEHTVFCIFKGQLCDGVGDCPYDEDEANCPEKVNFSGDQCKYKCHNGNCLDEESSVCDGTDDCADNSDEFHCGISCSLDNDLYQCSDNSSCLILSMVCNGVKNCLDGSDEGPLCSEPLCTTIKCPSDKCVQLPMGPQCHCGKNFNLVEGNTDYCEDIDECQTYGICSQICTNLPGSYQCSCHAGYKLEADNWTCSTYQLADSWIFYSTGMEINKFNPATGEDMPVVGQVSNVSAMSGDNNYLYWTESHQLCRLKHGRKSVEWVTLIGLELVTSVAVDWLTGNVYLADETEIVVCSEEGKWCHALMPEDLEVPHEVAVEPSNGLLFWTDWGTASYIGSSLMDGHGQRHLITDVDKFPHGLSVDPLAGRLYWMNGDTLESVKLNGEDRIVLLHKPHFKALHMQVLGKNLYWTGHDRLELRSMDKFTVEKPKSVLEKAGMSHIYAWTGRTLKKTDNPCSGNPCEYLCLLAGNGNYSCAEKEQPRLPKISMRDKYQMIWETTETEVVGVNRRWKGYLSTTTKLDLISRWITERGDMKLKFEAMEISGQVERSSSIFWPIVIPLSILAIVISVATVLYHCALKPGHWVNQLTKRGEERNELSGEKVELPNVVYNLEDAVVCNVRVVSV